MMESKRNTAPFNYTEQCSAYARRASGSRQWHTLKAKNPGRSRVAASRRRADARRNEQALLDAAAAVFVRSGVEAPVRDVAAAAGVGMGTIYRHFPTRADLIIAVYRSSSRGVRGRRTGAAGD